MSTHNRSIFKGVPSLYTVYNILRRTAILGTVCSWEDFYKLCGVAERYYSAVDITKLHRYSYMNGGGMTFCCDWSTTDYPNFLEDYAMTYTRHCHEIEFHEKLHFRVQFV